MKKPIQSAGEAMPSMNRRSLLMGLAAASIAAGAASGAIAETSMPTVVENEQLLLLGDQLAGATSAFFAARSHRRAVLEKWSPLWPAAPDAILSAGFYRGEKERGLDGYPIERAGATRAMSVLTSADMNEQMTKIRRILNSNRLAVKGKANGHTRAEWEESLADHSALWDAATAYEAECSRIKAASGFTDAEGACYRARVALVSLITSIMTQPERTMAGIVVKAQALSLTGDAEVFSCTVFDGRKWASELSASVLKIAADQGART